MTNFSLKSSTVKTGLDVASLRSRSAQKCTLHIVNLAEDLTRRRSFFFASGDLWGGFLTPRFPLCKICTVRHLRRDRARPRDLRKSLIVSKRRAALFIKNWSLNIKKREARTSQSRAIRSQSQISWNFWYWLLWVFEFWDYVWLDKCSSINLWMKTGGPTFWHYSRHSTSSGSCKTSCKRPKCVIFAQAGINAYDTVGNRRVMRPIYQVSYRRTGRWRLSVKFLYKQKLFWVAKDLELKLLRLV